MHSDNVNMAREPRQTIISNIYIYISYTTMDTYMPRYLNTCIIYTYVHNNLHTYVVNISSHLTLSLFGSNILKRTALGC